LLPGRDGSFREAEFGRPLGQVDRHGGGGGAAVTVADGVGDRVDAGAAAAGAAAAGERRVGDGVVTVFDHRPVLRHPYRRDGERVAVGVGIVGQHGDGDGRGVRAGAVVDGDRGLVGDVDGDGGAG